MRTSSARFAAVQGFSERPRLADDVDSSATRSATTAGGFSSRAGSIPEPFPKVDLADHPSCNLTDYRTFRKDFTAFLADQAADVLRGFCSSQERERSHVDSSPSPQKACPLTDRYAKLDARIGAQRGSKGATMLEVDGRKRTGHESRHRAASRRNESPASRCRERIADSEIRVLNAIHDLAKTGNKRMTHPGRSTPRSRETPQSSARCLAGFF